MTLALQRLRQGRCHQQLLSLLQWHQQQQQAHLECSQQRGMAREATSRQFAKERKGFQESLSDLRKEWAKVRLEKEAAKATAEATAKAALDVARAQRKQKNLEFKAHRLAEYEEKEVAKRELRAAAKRERLMREQLRGEVMDVAREEQRRLLLLQSCNWVAPSTLEERIQEALENPVPLHA